MEKNLIFEETLLQQKELAIYGSLFAEIGQFSEDLSREGLKLTHELFNDFFQRGWMAVSSALVIKSSGENPMLAGLIQHEAQRAAKKYEPYREKFTKILYRLHIAHTEIAFKDDRPYLPEKKKKEILEKYRYYLTTEKAQEFYNQLVTFTEHFNSLATNLEGNGYPALSDMLLSTLTESAYDIGEEGLGSKELRNDIILLLDEGKLSVNHRFFKK